jgi:hypothetical protein
METHYNKPSTAGIALKWGAIAGLLSIIFTAILYMTGQANNKWLSSLGFLFLVGGIVYAIKEFKSQSGGHMSFGEGLGLGSLVSAVIGLLSGTFSAFYIKFVDDSFVKTTLQQQRLEMEQQGMDDAQIDQAIALAENFAGPGAIFLFGFLGTLLVGFILSLIISAIMKNDHKDLNKLV